MKNRLYIRRILYIPVLLLMTWLGIKNVVPSGTLYIHHALSNPSKLVTDFRPGELFSPWQQEHNSVYHTLHSGPIFFHVYTPRPFQTVHIGITYRTLTPHTPQFGGQTGPQLYEFNYIPLNIIPDGQWHTTFVDIDLGRMYYHKTNKRYQFSFIEPQQLDISTLDFTFQKPPITPENVWERMTH